MVTPIDTSLLLGIFNARLGITGGVGAAGPSAAPPRVAPTAPWLKAPTDAQTSAAVKSAMGGQKFIDENGAKLDLKGASTDYRKLFAMYQGLSVLSGIVEQAQKTNVSSGELTRLQKTFARGLAEISTYAKTADLDLARLTAGEVGSTAQSTLAVPRAQTDYITAPLHTGDSGDAVPQFSGDVKFTITTKWLDETHQVDIDLAGMGAQTRSMSNVVTYINDQLKAAGVDTRFALQRLPGQPRTTTAGGKTIDLGPGPDQWAFKITPGNETVSFSAAATAGAVYMAQAIGDPDPDGRSTTADGKVSQQFVKFQTDTATIDSPVQGEMQANWVDGRVFAKTLGPEIARVRATQTGADGSVYMLADVTGQTAGQDIRGSQDVALLKYDAAGNLVYTRTLGASQTASGLGLALSADGDIAVAGSVTGGLNGATNGPLNSGDTGFYANQSDSFVTVFNADGEELWTQRRGAREADEASQVAFGADGTVYVAGRSKSVMPGGTTLGDWDGYVEAFAPPTASGVVTTNFTQSFGTSSADRPAGMVVDGTSLVTASVENGHAVLRRFDLSGGTPVLSSTRDLGDLQGGDITGLALDGGQLVIAGSTANASLSAGSVTRAHAGGIDAFAARVSADLSSGPGDAIAYYGGAGDDKATALSVSNGQVWIAGSAGTDLPGQPPVGKQDGFLTRLDVAAGTVDWSRRFTGKDGFAAPSSIAVDTTGASGLDKLGLPKGEIDLSGSQQITAASSLRAGDQFTVAVGSGRPQTVTIEAKDTLDTLALKIRRATAFQVKVTIGVSNGVRKLTVAPLNDRTIIEFGAGKADKNALEMLGIQEGVVRKTTTEDGKTMPADGRPQIYGLGLASDLNLNGKDNINHAAAEVLAAMGVIRNIYKDLVAAATPRSAQAAGPTGPVPAYLQAQIANYQAALARLGGSG